MNILLIAVGKLNNNYLKKGIEDFTDRLKPYSKLRIIEVKEEKAPESLSKKQKDEVLAKEGDNILKKLPSGSYNIALDIKGKQLTSEELAKKIDNLALSGKSNIAFIIGGSLGLSKEVLNKTDFKLSFSKFTFPHQLMRLILLEQIYRAFKINKNEPYHK